MKKPFAIALSATLVPVALAAPQPAYAAAVFVVNSTDEDGDAALNGMCETSTAGDTPPGTARRRAPRACSYRSPLAA
jgi:hypothetical protein